MRANEDFPKTVKHGNVTVKIYRIKHRTTASGFAYVVAYTGTDGIRRLPQFADEAAAVEEARLKASQISAGRADAADMSRADRDELQAARSLAGDLPLLAALQEWRRARELTNGHLITAAESWAARNSTSFEPITVETAIERFVTAKKNAGVNVAASYLKILPTFKTHAGDQLLATISGRQLQQWLDERYPHPVTRNTARRRLVALWRWARKQGYLPRDAMTEAEQTETAREETGIIAIISPDVSERLLRLIAADHSHYLPALVVACFCGLRRAEVHEQVWEDIDLQRRLLRVTKAKRNTPARRLVPITPAACEWLMQTKKREGRICPNLAIDRIRDIARTASFTLGDNCFRHSYISYRVALTGNVAETALEAGNSPQIIFRHYRELVSKAQGRRWFRIRPKGSGSNKPTTRP
jgi:integrase